MRHISSKTGPILCVFSSQYLLATSLERLFRAHSITFCSLVITLSLLLVDHHYFLVHYFSLLLITMNEALHVRLEKVFVGEMMQVSSNSTDV